MKTIRTGLAGLLFLAFGSVAAAQATVYVKVGEADIREGLGGRVVESVPQGTALTVVEASRLALTVRTPSGNQGVIPARQVQDAPPSTGRGGLGGLVREDREVTEMRTSASYRGISEEALELAEAEGISEEAIEDQRAAENLATSISEAEVERFAREGGLGQ